MKFFIILFVIAAVKLFVTAQKLSKLNCTSKLNQTIQTVRNAADDFLSSPFENSDANNVLNALNGLLAQLPNGYLHNTITTLITYINTAANDIPSQKVVAISIKYNKICMQIK